MLEIIGVLDGPRLEDVRVLFDEYALSLGVDLSFQGFAQELAGLPGDYAPPSGRLMLCTDQGRALGCVGVRSAGGGACEMKRLYVRSEARGRGIGRRLAEAATDWARDAGYERVLLDTLPSMTGAQRMYQQLGFTDVPPYRFNPIAGTRFMSLALKR